MRRIIGHLDLDYFYAQVEERDNPSIKGRPVIVCVFSGRSEESGVVSTANYVARGFGVKSGIPIAMAKRKLEGRNPVVIKMDRQKYEIVSKKVMEVVADRVDAIELAGIDEAFFDLTMSSGGDYSAATEMARGIKDVVLADEKLTCSIGLGRSKVVAKVCSESAKPGGLLTVTDDMTLEFLAGLDVSKLYGVGPKTTAALREMGVKTAGDLARADREALDARFGRSLSRYLLEASTGTDQEPVREGLEPTQLSRIVTLKRDTKEPQEILGQLERGIAQIHDKLVDSGKSFRTLTVIGILNDLSVRTKGKTYATPANDEATLRGGALDLFIQLTASSEQNLRRAGLRVSGLSHPVGQKSLSEYQLEDA